MDRSERGRTIRQHFIACERMAKEAVPGIAVDYGRIGRQVAAIVEDKVKGAAKQIVALLLPDMVKAALASNNLMVRRGKTAGQILRESGFPAVKGLAGWFGNRLVQLGYAIKRDGRSEQGDRTARMFDPDKVGVWLRAGGRVTVEQKSAERRGQTVIDFGVGKITPFRAVKADKASPPPL